MSPLDVEWLGGNCPVQAEGWVGCQKFYFRARGNRWTMSIGGEDPVASPALEYGESYGGDDDLYAAGWMDEDEALAFIVKAVGQLELNIDPEKNEALKGVNMPRCPACNHEQVQLLNMAEPIAEWRWRCRICRHGFNQKDRPHVGS